MIPDDAVEAAAKATFEHANFDFAWEGVELHWKAAYRASVLAGLEAAAPHILEANEECCCGNCGL